MIKFSIKIWLMTSIIMLSGCAKYQQHFGGKSADYSNVTVTEKVKYPAQVNALHANDRYSIPAIQSCEDVLELSPPDYRQ